MWVRARLADILFLAHINYYQNANIAIGIFNFCVVTFTKYPFSVITGKCSCWQYTVLHIRHGYSHYDIPLYSLPYFHSMRMSVPFLSYFQTSSLDTYIQGYNKRNRHFQCCNLQGIILKRFSDVKGADVVLTSRMNAWKKLSFLCDTPQIVCPLR